MRAGREAPGAVLAAGVDALQKDVDACRIEEPWLWAWRGLANYIVPKVDVQVSAIMRSQPNLAATNDPASNGLSMSANYFERRQHGRAARASLAGNAPLVTLDMARLGDVYPDRLDTVDMRVSKVLRFGRFRANVGFDLYNLFNANTGIFRTHNGLQPELGTDGSTWLRPNTIRIRGTRGSTRRGFLEGCRLRLGSRPEDGTEAGLAKRDPPFFFCWPGARGPGPGAEGGE